MKIYRINFSIALRIARKEKTELHKKPQQSLRNFVERAISSSNSKKSQLRNHYLACFTTALLSFSLEMNAEVSILDC